MPLTPLSVSSARFATRHMRPYLRGLARCGRRLHLGIVYPIYAKGECMSSQVSGFSDRSAKLSLRNFQVWRHETLGRLLLPLVI
ncbi:hypothetical protein PMI11_03412 [Rhizobium sp. CF142]|nr:hypothetical protein PMI11_03412 [Rhizobium sp. CF142]